MLLLSGFSMTNKENAYGPTFVGIGMAKSGTTWLDRILRLHHDVWLPPIKEMHFFDEYFDDEGVSLRSRLFSHKPYKRARCRRYLKSETRRLVRYPNIENAAWWWRLFSPFSERDFDWYASVFSSRGSIQGEITPEYCILEPFQIREIRSHFPDLKIILLLRNPIDRTWSHAKMELCWRANRPIGDVREHEFIDFFNDHGVAKRAQYSRIIENWTKEFGENSLFIRTLDDIIESPVRVVESICRFLEIRSNPIISSEKILEPVFRGISGDVPLELKNYLKNLYREEIMKTAASLERADIADWAN